MPAPLVIRADASSRIGTGHVMRMLALAQAAADRGSRTVFVCAEIPEALEARLRKEGFPVERIAAVAGTPGDAATTVDIARRHRGTPDAKAWIVTDGYAFDATYQGALRNAGFRVMVIDDYNHLPAYDCDLLVNQNIGAEELRYAFRSPARRMPGPRFAMLRREFRAAMKQVRATARPARPGEPVRVLVTMGGADIHHMTGKVLHALSGLNDRAFHVRAVVGAAYPDFDALVAALPAGPHRLECLRNVENMPELMQWADLAVTAAGSTCWELLGLGVPMLVVVVAENQARIGRLLGERGIATDLGWYDAWSDERFVGEVRRLTADPARIDRFREAGRRLVDGDGVDRLLDAMSRPLLSLRPAVSGDARTLWLWANDPETRAASFASAEIPWEDHVRWFEARLASPSSTVYIAESGDAPVGVVRFDVDKDGIAVISVAVAPDARLRGIGATLIEQGTCEFAATGGCRTVLAYIKPENERSSRAFEKAGYRHTGETTVREQRAVVMTWTPDAAPTRNG